MTAQIVLQFIEEIWNRQLTSSAGDFLHPAFIDHSLPDSLPTGAEGLQKWVQLTSASFIHRTIVEDHVTESDKCVLRITMQLTHIGTWRGKPATGMEVSTSGYRMFRVQDGKIIEHWALVDGSALESRLRGAEHACKVAQ
jgi:predicted SnoaL-like aldol condensation-catalyzing enzyme